MKRTQTLTAAISEVEEIQIILPRGDMLIYHEEREDVEVTLIGNHQTQLTMEQKGKELHVEVTRKRFLQWISRSAPKMEVRIPQAYSHRLSVEIRAGRFNYQGLAEAEGISLSELKLRLEAGDIRINHLHTNNLTQRVVAGTVNVHKVRAKKMELSITAGTAYVSQCTGGLDANITTGSLHAGWSELTEPIKARVMTGEIFFDLPEGSTYRLDAKTRIGHVYFGSEMTDGPQDDRKEVNISQGVDGLPVALKVDVGTIHVA
ncbi:Putative adhesin [Marininema mesophilum]|uniref:Putative adhesin n=1 Tax=Marininema mesophilum TaxID=1048340 RepID=A0A1H2YDU6_9BACL|nr:DUF4097 family beta strand repeat-containing protein [Marininema mesophilum]SDX03346.1 Putative adhesin [Marininema mesophilum]